ncbi:MAG: S8 family serine peptidase, partial [Actinomycetota bacterium]|nr:S8 family serine peptidase [Actinomycetota bacterium]
MRRRVAVIALTIVAAVTGGAAFPSGALAQREGAKDFYYGIDDRRVGLTVRLGEVGLVAREGVTAKELRRRLRLRTVRRIGPTLFVAVLGRRLTRPQLVTQARRLRARHKGLLRDAGLAVRESGVRTSMIVTDELIAEFDEGVTREQIEALNAANAVEVVREEPNFTNRFLLRVTRASRGDAITVANRYHEDATTTFAHPNLWIPQQLHFTPNDPLYPDQWHHENAGTSSCLTSGSSTFCDGTADADADSSKAWDVTRGATSTVIAVMDGGTQFSHPDLTGNHQLNAGEVAGNSVDDDANGFVDDVNGWDFVAGTNNPSGTTEGHSHGTAAAGVAAADGDNSTGVSGECPDCRFIPLRVCCGASSASIQAAFGYARARGARVLTNSWGYNDPASTVPPATVTAIDAVSTATPPGTVVFSGGNNSSAAYCVGGYPSIASVIAVSSSTNLDRKVRGHAFGNCIDVLAPTRFSPNDPTVGSSDPAWLSQHTGTLAVTTVDRSGSGGYNTGHPDSTCTNRGITDLADTDYTNCFSGTSSAAPLAAGAVALAFTARSTSTPLELRRLLQDTADKIEDSLGAYAGGIGFSSPASGVATHSWGRLNAFEAARVVAPSASGGRDGVDVFLRDNRLDWGNTERPSNYLFEPDRGYIGHWKSQDIKIDAPPLQPAPTTNDAFEALVDEAPRQGDANRVYVRVRNRGPVTASEATVKLHWTQFGTALPALPPDFWGQFPNDSADVSQWRPIDAPVPLSDLAYSGASVAGCPGRAQPACDGGTDAAQIAAFEWTAPDPDPALPNHFCLLAIVDSPQDRVNETRVVVDSVTPTNNNVTHRNVAIELSGGQSEFRERFFVRNPTDSPVRAVLTLAAPRRWKVSSSPPAGRAFDLRPGEERLATLSVRAPSRGAR